jgi:CheY-like chemotaxis protein
VPSPARHAISIDRLTLQLLPILNRVIEAELLSPETQPMTVPLPHDDAQFPAAWPQPGAAAGAGAAQFAPTPSVPGQAPPGRLPATNAAPAPVGAAPPAAASRGQAAASPPPRAPLPPAPAGHAARATAGAPATRSTALPDAARPAPRDRSTAPAGVARPSQPASSQAPADGRQGIVGVDSALRRPRILVVDDSPTVRQQLGIAFTRMGFVCEMVPTGELALDRLAAARYDLVMVDVMIPDMDGYRLTREIRKRYRGTPVVILSSRGSPFDHARGLLAGCKAYLAKPVPLRELEAAILKALRKSVAAGELEQLLRNAAAARAAAARGAAARVAAPAAAPGRPAQAVARPAAASVPQPADARA